VQLKFCQHDPQLLLLQPTYFSDSAQARLSKDFKSEPIEIVLSGIQFDGIEMKLTQRYLPSCKAQTYRKEPTEEGLVLLTFCQQQ